MGNGLRGRWGFHYLWFIQRHWEPELSAYFATRHGELFVDVGANLGLYCVELQHNFDRVIAIEADPRVYAELVTHTPPNCQCFNIAVSDRDGWVDLYIVEEPAEGNALARATITLEKNDWGTEVKSEARKPVQVQTAPLSKILDGEKRVDLVKVDVEGAEWVVLKGAASIMAAIKEWVIEVHHQGRKRELENLMKGYGYTHVQWLEGPAAPHGIFRRDDSS